MQGISRARIAHGTRCFPPPTYPLSITTEALEDTALSHHFEDLLQCAVGEEVGQVVGVVEGHLVRLAHVAEAADEVA